ncbi:CrcB-like protein-domain-containing protein [Xylaria arbuscula]|nr:CrcB-like protein-domain-containing protein [Xylaria arbuscula]
MPSEPTHGTALRPTSNLDATLHNAQDAQNTAGMMRSTASPARSPSETASGYDAPESYLNLSEVQDVSAIQDRNELSQLDSQSIEELESRLHDIGGEAPQPSRGTVTGDQRPQGDSPIQSSDDGAAVPPLSRWATEFYTVSYLILFAIFGTLARLGLQALTFYPGAAIPFSSVWPNFAGTLVIGFLTEDRMLFRYERGNKPLCNPQPNKNKSDDEDESGSPRAQHATQDPAAAKKAHLAVKKTIPLYIGLATGFCGSFTSFSSFIRDIFLALSNDMPMPDGASTPRNGGYSFLALLAVLIGTISLSFSGLHLGAHLAEAWIPIAPSLRYPVSRRFLDPLAVVLAWGSWIGAIILSIVPPDRYSNPGLSEFWRGRATFALVFAPLGCLTRFYVSARLNGRSAAFPLGTFAVNIAGTAILGLSWDLAHARGVAGVIGCQVLQGIEDGFCGCLTTVSTWVLELAVLGRRRAYRYGAASVGVALGILVAVMGGLRWSDGFEALSCVH